MTVYAAIAGLLAMMGGFVWLASLENPDLEQAEIKLASVEFVEEDKIENSAEFNVTFLVKNPAEKTFTVSKIDYSIYANGNRVGVGLYSAEDIPMPGRAIFYEGAEIPLETQFRIIRDLENAEIYDALLSGNQPTLTVEGVIMIETAWSLIEKEFNTSL